MCRSPRCQVCHRASYQGEICVLKKLPMVGVPASKRARILHDFCTELAIMVELRSPRCVSVFGVVTADPTFLGLVVEFCEGGDLRTRLDRRSEEEGIGEAEDVQEVKSGSLSDDIEPDQKKLWLSDIASGMQYLYAKKIEHRDLKSANVLLDIRSRAKVTDFGLSRSDDLATQTFGGDAGNGSAGTPAFMAPELLLDNTFSEKSDVYSFAVVIWEVLTRDRPYEGLKPVQISMQVISKKKRPPLPPKEAVPNSLASLVTLMQQCWEQEPADRPTFSEIANSIHTDKRPHFS